jgi:hypothetical protein
MGDHSADMVLPVAKVKTSFPSFTISFLRALPLFEEFAKGHAARRKYAEIPVKGHDPFIVFKSQRCTNRDCFLAYSTEPFGYFPLPEKDQHFFFDHAGPEQGFIKFFELFVTQLFPVKRHNANVLK